MKKSIIGICDEIHRFGIEFILSQKNIDAIDLFEIPKADLPHRLKDIDVIITRSSTVIDSNFVEKQESLKAIVRAGVGVDNIDIKTCTKKGIVVMNVPTANTIAAVELTIAHMLGTARSFPYAHNNLKQDRVWNRSKWYGIELSGKKLGIIGFGNIGSRVGIIAKSFGMDILAYDPYILSTKVTSLGMSYTKKIEDILNCDFITIHTPKNSETIDIINYKEIEQMRNGIRLINCARGGLYNENALYDGLRSGKIAFLGIDVFEQEPALDNRLLECDNICVTPHLGANTHESQQKISLQACEQAVSFIKRNSYQNALNIPFKGELNALVRPYFELMQKMSFMASQIKKGSISSVSITIEGDIAEYGELILICAIVGSLRLSVGDNINYVNAKHIANSRGVKTSFKKIKNSSGYLNKINLSLVATSGAIEMSGTVFGENRQMIVSIDEFVFDVEPKDKMIIYKNKDVPGVIADVGRILANSGINIADFRLSRNKDNLALCAVLVDGDVSKEAIDKLSSLDAFLWVSYVVME